MPKWSKYDQPKYPLTMSTETSIAGDTLSTKLRLIQSNKELLERKIQEYERKLNRIQSSENSRLSGCESARDIPQSGQKKQQQK